MEEGLDREILTPAWLQREERSVTPRSHAGWGGGHIKRDEDACFRSEKGIKVCFCY